MEAGALSVSVRVVTTIKLEYIRKEGLTQPIRCVQWPVRCCITLISGGLWATTA